MATPTKTVIDASTGEVTIEEFTADDIKDLKKINEELAVRELRKSDREALLTKLGITADEAALLLS
jgi:hypothetical protein